MENEKVGWMMKRLIRILTILCVMTMGFSALAEESTDMQDMTNGGPTGS